MAPLLAHCASWERSTETQVQLEIVLLETGTDDIRQGVLENLQSGETVSQLQSLLSPAALPI